MINPILVEDLDYQWIHIITQSHTSLSNDLIENHFHPAKNHFHLIENHFHLAKTIFI